LGAIEYRQTERDAICRGCHKDIKKHTEKVIYTYSSANRGMHIFFCGECIEVIKNLIEEGVD